MIDPFSRMYKHNQNIKIYNRIRVNSKGTHWTDWTYSLADVIKRSKVVDFK